MNNKRNYILGAFLLVLLLIGTIVFVRNRSGVVEGASDDQSLTPTTNPTPQNPMPNTGTPNNWNTYQFPQGNISFQYPSDWTVQSTTDSNGMPRLMVKSPSNFVIDVTYRAASTTPVTCVSDPNTEMGTDTINIPSLNMNMNVFYFGNKTTNTISYAYVNNNTSACPNNPYVTIPAQFNSLSNFQQDGQIYVKMYYANVNESSTSNFMSGDLDAAKNIISSLTTTNM